MNFAILNAMFVTTKNRQLFWNDYQKQPSELFYKKTVLKNFAIFTGKHLCWSSFLIKLQAFRLIPSALFKWLLLVLAVNFVKTEWIQWYKGKEHFHQNSLTRKLRNSRKFDNFPEKEHDWLGHGFEYTFTRVHLF